MNRKIKYGALLVLILSFVVGYTSYAEEKPVDNGFKKSFGEGFVESNKEKRVEDRQMFRDSLKEKQQEIKMTLGGLMDDIREKRQEFKTELKNNEELNKTERIQMRQKFQEELKGIKDEKKKLSAEKIVALVEELNTKITDNLSKKVDQIEDVLVSIKSRMTKAEDRGLDVSSVQVKVDKALESIDQAREAISKQAGKVYEINITDENTLKSEMKTLRDTFKADIKAVRDEVKLAHQAVRDTAIALAQIPKIDDDNNPNEVEDKNVDNTN